MNIENLIIDDVVRSVLADLKRQGETIGVCALPKNEGKRDAEIYLDSRVVSIAEIRQIGEGATLFVSPKCVLTPSAKDEIRKRKIRLATRLPRPKTETAKKTWLAAHLPAVFSFEMLKRLGTKQIVFDSLENLLSTARNELANDDSYGIALSRQSAKLLVEANRFPTLRAIPGFSVGQVAEDMEETDANLLVVHPDRCGGRLLEIIQKYANR